MEPRTPAQILKEILPGDPEGDPLNQALYHARGMIEIKIGAHSIPEAITSAVWREYVVENQGLSTTDQAKLQICAALAAVALGVRGTSLRGIYRKAGLTPLN